ncbi:MAG: hypothetical protein J5833_08690 [Victivallales bacterium]|nr:hypothetical protein [Victivallales bacterium]
MNSNENIEHDGGNGRQESHLAWLLLAIAVYIVRIMPWAMSEFWYDEVLTIGNFLLDHNEVGLVDCVFRNYPIANNHILSSVVYWYWVRLLDFNLSAEHLIRIPSIFFGLSTILIVSLHWRKWLGNRVAGLAAMMFAISPVFTAFAYQLRGYSLSMLLSAIAISGALECASGKKFIGTVVAFIACLLLPLTIPSNALVVPVIALVIFLCSDKMCKGMLLAAVPVIGGIIGGCYYFTIWEQFIEASKEPGGWPSAWAVAQHLAVAFIVHAGIVISCIPFGRKAQADARPRLRRLPPIVLAATVVVIGATLLFAHKGQAPYPRVFLVFLPVTTLAVLFAAKDSFLSYSKSFLPLVAILAVGLAVEKLSTNMTERELAVGKSPLNLLQQYYRGSSEIRRAASILAEEQLLGNCIVITDEYDLPTMELYCTMHSENARVLSPNKSERGFILKEPSTRVLALAKTPEIAARLLSHAGYGTEERLLELFTDESFADEMRMTLFAECGEIRGLYAPPILLKRNTPPPTKENDKSLIL